MCEVCLMTNPRKALYYIRNAENIASAMDWMNRNQLTFIACLNAICWDMFLQVTTVCPLYLEVVA